MSIHLCSLQVPVFSMSIQISLPADSSLFKETAKTGRARAHSAIVGVRDWDRALFLGYPAASRVLLPAQPPPPSRRRPVGFAQCQVRLWAAELRAPTAESRIPTAPPCSCVSTNSVENELKIPFRFLQIPSKCNLSSVPFYYRGGGCLFHPHGLPPAPYPAPQH